MTTGLILPILFEAVKDFYSKPIDKIKSHVTIFCHTGSLLARECPSYSIVNDLSNV